MCEVPSSDYILRPSAAAAAAVETLSLRDPFKKRIFALAGAAMPPFEQGLQQRGAQHTHDSKALLN